MIRAYNAYHLHKPLPILSSAAREGVGRDREAGSDVGEGFPLTDMRRFDLKILRKCIIIISIIALILLLLMEVIWGDGDPRAKFICSWVRVILIFLVIPLVFGGLSLAYNADKINPKIWMAIYGCVAFAYIAIVIRTGYINTTRDLPLAIEREYSAVSGSMQSIDFDETSRFVEVGSIYFELPREDFETVDFDTEYTVTYLPNTKTVMSIDLEDRSD